MAVVVVCGLCVAGAVVVVLVAGAVLVVVPDDEPDDVDDEPDGALDPLLVVDVDELPLELWEVEVP